VILAFILYSRNADGWVWPVFGACAGVYLFYRGFRMLRRKRLILNTPTSKVRSAAMGLVEVNGLAVGPYVMNAPITGLPCYYHRSIAWQWKQSGKSKSWQKVADESRHLLFFVDDNTGRVLVNPQGAEMDIHRDFHEEFSTSFFSSGLDVPANVSTFLMRHGISTDKKIKVEEYCIKPKNALFIVGTLSENPGLRVSPDPVVTEPEDVLTASVTWGKKTLSAFAGNGGADMESLPAQEIIRLSPATKPAKSMDMSQQARISAALMKAGITNPAAWAVAGVERSGIALDTQPKTDPAVAVEKFDLNPKTVLMKGANDPAFFISWQSQRDVLKTLSWKSTLMIWGGPVLTLLCFYILAAEFGWL
jgi:E3 ubiquitin ligase